MIVCRYHIIIVYHALNLDHLPYTTTISYACMVCVVGGGGVCHDQSMAWSKCMVDIWDIEICMPYMWALLTVRKTHRVCPHIFKTGSLYAGKLWEI